MISLQNVSKSFGDIKAVSDVSLNINKGEIVGFLGPNGAGKSTTIRMIAGFLVPDQGKVIIDDKDITENPIETRKLIGYLPENNPMYEGMLVSEFLEFAADLKSIPKEDRKEEFDFVVKSTGIEDVYYRTIAELSKGYHQRVGIAAALLGRPDIIILDEPSEGLDPNQRTEIRKLIKSLAENHTIILCTHVMQEASAVCNRLVIINQGQIVKDGSIEELSKTAGAGRVIKAIIEGNDIEIKLKNLSEVKQVTITKLADNKFEAKIIVDSEKKIEPMLSKLLKENDWILWKLVEEQRGLEDVFRTLTKANDE